MAEAIPAVVAAFSTVAAYVAPIAQVISAVSTIGGLFSKGDDSGEMDFNMQAISSPLQDTDLQTDDIIKAEVEVEEADNNLADTAEAQRQDQRRRQMLQQQAFATGGTSQIGSQTGSFG